MFQYSINNCKLKFNFLWFVNTELGIYFVFTEFLEIILILSFQQKSIVCIFYELLTNDHLFSW